MPLYKVRLICFFLAGFFVGSCAAAFVFGLLFFYAAAGNITISWLSNRTLVGGITNVVGLLCGVICTRRCSK